MNLVSDSGGPMATEPLRMRRRVVRHALLVVTVFATSLSGTSCVEVCCAPRGTVVIRPTRAACAWLELVDERALEVTRLRTTYGEEASCTALKAPGQYRLRRAEYTVEFWNGERWFPQLFIRARGADGTARIRRAVLAERGSFNYVLNPEFRSRFQPPLERLEFNVLDLAGIKLGRESIRIVRKTGGDVRSFF
jgi:hypothetical protein